MFPILRQSPKLQLNEDAHASGLAAPPLNPGSNDHVLSTVLATPSKVSPLDVNEILYSIFSFLDQNTIRTAVFSVCRRWRSLASRYILYTLRVHHDNKGLLEDLSNQLLHFNKLEVGQKIRRLAWRPSPEEAARSHEMMDQLIQALEQIQSNRESEDRLSSVLDSQLPHDLEGNRNHLFIKVLTLNLEVPSKLDPLLSVIVPSTLKELTIDFEFSTNAFYLGTLLDRCSNLLHLILSSHKIVPLGQGVVSKSQVWIHSDSDKEGCRPHPLRSLHIINMCVLPS